jgi:hypothetical protein
MKSRGFRPISLAAAIGDVMRRFTPLTAPPQCGICGKGHASTGWIVDPVGRVSGRCRGCVGDTPAVRW